MSKQKMVVEWSPHDTSLFAVGADNLRLFETTTSPSAASVSTTSAGAPVTSGDSNDVLPLSSGLASASTSPAATVTTQRKRSFRLVKINAQVTQLKCMEWYPHANKPLLIAAGMGSGKVVLSDFNDTRVRAVREYVPKYSRPCNAVAWNTAVPNQLAAGFDKVRSDFCTLVWDLNASSGALGASTIAGSGNSSADAMLMGDSDGMDVISGSMMLMGTGSGAPSSSSARKSAIASSSLGSGAGSGPSSGSSSSSSRSGFTRDNEKPVHELSNSEATVALSWVPSQPMCLATGTGFKWLRVYDLRTKGTAPAPLSVVAHNKAVLGVVFDQHRPHLLATYTDGPQEAVRVWDIRRLDASSGPVLSLHQTSKTLSHVAWCPSKPGILVTTSPDEKWISLWDVSKPETDGSTLLKKPFRRRYTSDPLATFSWQHVPTVSRAQPSSASGRSAAALKDIAAAAFPNRLLTVSLNGEIEDISVHDSMPISVSSLGSLAFSCGKLLFGGSTSSSSGQGTAAAARQALDAAAATRSSAFDSDDDISSEMYRLAKQGYSVDLSKSLKLFSRASPSPRHRELRNLWSWVDQVEVLRRVRANRVSHTRALAAGNTVAGVNPVSAVAPGPLRGWPFNANVLAVVGIKNLLSVSGDSPTASSVEASLNAATIGDGALTTIASALKTDPVLNCFVYEGLGRRLALLACNWDPDNGQASLRSNTAAFQGLGDSMPPPPRAHIPLHRSNSGAWGSQKQFEDATASAGAFGNRSDDESSRHELRSILAKCESEGNFPRAAMLAVFHGDLTAAVALLQRGAIWLSQLQSVRGAHAPPMAHSPDVLQLVAMAVAGYSSAAAMTTVGASGPSLWATMCQQLLKRDEIVSQSQPRYLHALLAFLCVAASSAATSARASQAQQQQQSRRVGATAASNGASNNTASTATRRAWGSVDGLSVFTGGPNNNSNSATSHVPRSAAAAATSSGVYASILNDATLPLSDRIAFACRFVGADDLRAFVTHHEDACVQSGRLDGLVLTGLNPTGIRILQTYVDATGDIQTLALLAARLPASFVDQTPPLGHWIVIYQDLLNQWQLFHERARFDVGRSRLEDVVHGFANFARDPDAENLQAELAAPSSLSVPPQLYVRCNFCNAALSLAHLLRQGGSHASWLNRAKPKLTCCPSCRKPLPQCALCLLPFGSLNPYFELAHRRSKLVSDAVSAAVTSAIESGSGVIDEPVSGSQAEHETLAQLSSIPFVEWFTWCQACKHGGHAHHLADWFATHTSCPVTDCACQCQHLDLPIMLNNRQSELIAQQQEEEAAAASAAAAAAATIAAAQRSATTSGSSGHSKKHHHSSSSESKRASVKHGSLAGTPLQQPSGASALGTSSSFRMLPPSRATLGYQSKLSSSVSSNMNALGGGGANGASGGTNNGLSGVSGATGSGGGGVNSAGSGSSSGDPMSMSMTLANRLDQLEKDKSGGSGGGNGSGVATGVYKYM